MPKISVIVPVYKVEPYLSRCVDSILGQSFTDFELILVDDGSPDHCPSMCDEYAQRDSRVHAIHQENGGLSAARNAGIDWAFANSDSEWLNFVDSDDWMHSETLERLLNAAESTQSKVAVVGFQETKGTVTEPTEEALKVRVIPTESFYLNQNAVATVAWGKLYSKSCFESIRYPVGRIHEDEFVTYRILFQEEQIAFIKAPMYFYYVNLEGITKSAWKPCRIDALDAYEEQLDFFQKNQYEEIFWMKVKKYLRTFALQIHDANQVQGYKKYKKCLKKRMRHAMKTYRYKEILELKETIWMREVAYPNLMKLYWYMQAAKRKIGIRK